MLFQMMFYYMPNKLKAFDFLFYQLGLYISEHLKRKKIYIRNDLIA